MINQTQIRSEELQNLRLWPTDYLCGFGHANYQDPNHFAAQLLQNHKLWKNICKDLLGKQGWCLNQSSEAAHGHKEDLHNSQINGSLVWINIGDFKKKMEKQAFLQVLDG